LESWGLGGGENSTILRVLKAVGLVETSNEPSDKYAEFMHSGTGPAVLGALIRQTYAPLFHAAHAPHKEPDDSLRNLFNIHSSGAQRTMDLQIQTFKALCDHASFDSVAEHAASPGHQAGRGSAGVGAPAPSTGSAPFHIDLHIHLPENKNSREYQYIIQDIAKFIFGREDVSERESDG
jgi:hypothetical protein